MINMVGPVHIGSKGKINKKDLVKFYKFCGLLRIYEHCHYFRINFWQILHKFLMFPNLSTNLGRTICPDLRVFYQHCQVSKKQDKMIFLRRSQNFGEITQFSLMLPSKNIGRFGQDFVSFLEKNNFKKYFGVVEFFLNIFCNPTNKAKPLYIHIFRNVPLGLSICSNITKGKKVALHTACISFWILKRQAISTDKAFILKKINEN